jgi:phosphomannomutase
VLNPKVFKAYDVRGIYPDELDEAGAYAIGRAYVDEFAPRRIAVGRDMRLSSPAMAGAVMRGAADSGADVLDIGLVGTEMVYFAVGELGLEGGIAVTASHNPKEYTGMKIVRRGALPVGGDSGLLDIRTRAEGDLDPPQDDGSIRAETTPASSFPATSSRRCWRSRCWRRSPARRSSTTCAPAGLFRRQSSVRAECRS